MKDKKLIPQHTRMAMGEKLTGQALKKGGRVTGMPMNPITKARRSNGIPGMKDGGKCR